MRREVAARAQVAAVYVRVSTEAQDEEGSSLQTQEARCREYARQRGLAVDEAHVYREIHTGVELYQRPALTRLRDAMRRGAVGTVIAYALDRLARDPMHLAVVVSEADHYGVEIAFVTEELDKSPTGQLILAAKGFAAKLEHEKIKERTLRGKLARVQSGKLPNGCGELYGYLRDRDAGTRSVVETEAAVVRQVYSWVADGEPIRAVIRRLNETQVPPPSAGKRRFSGQQREPRWGKGAVQRLLTDPSYKGEAFAWRRKRDPLRGSVIRPEEEWIRLPDGTVPAIVSPDLWALVQERLAANKGAATRNRSRPYLLRGRIRCAVCGLAMYSTPEGDRRMYRCSSKDQPTGPCGGRRVPADEVETWAWEQVHGVLKDPAVVFAELERRRHSGPDREKVNELDSARQAAEELQRQLHRLVEALADGSLPAGMVRKSAEDKQRRLSRLQQRIDELDAQLRDAAAESALAPETLHDICRRVAAKVSGMGFEDRRLALEALAVEVVANGCGRRGSPLQWRVDGSIPLGPDVLEGLETGVLSTTRAGCAHLPLQLLAPALPAPDHAHR